MSKITTLFLLIFLQTAAFGQIVTPKGKNRPVRTKPLRIATNDTNRVYVIKHAPQNMRFVQYAVEVGCTFIADSAQRYYLPKKQVIHYGFNIRVGDIYKNRVYGIFGLEFYAQRAYKGEPGVKPESSGKTTGVNNTYNSRNVFNFMGHMGCQVPFHLSELTSINLSSSLMFGISGTPNYSDEINFFGIRLAANIERRLGTLPVIAYFGVAYDNNFLFRRDHSPATRNPNLLKLYFGIRI
ncbi:hypothetical protein [Fluviicola sp.]|uniref:hypothetical protein n=1 Tax=Fluviicola sp. TaxID=1917219 RepID=UPI00261B0863|nr:hypothetical protein [Fluviicola sp.]